MKKIFTAIFIFLALKSSKAQSLNVDSIIPAISAEKNEDKKVELITTCYTPEFNNNPGLVIKLGMDLLKQSQNDKDIIEESSAYSFLGHGYRLLGNNIRGLNYHHKAMELAEKSGNFTILAISENQTAHVYKDRYENEKAIRLYLSSAAHAEQGKLKLVTAWPFANLGSVYLSSGNLDSSLMYSQRAYEYCVRTKDMSSLILVFINLAGVQSRLGNSELALSYFNMALKEVSGTPYLRYFNLAYTGMAEHYRSINQADSAELYARKAISIVDNTAFFYLSSKPAQLLTDMYEKRNCDSTLKYAKIFRSAHDSLNNNRANQQILLMTFDEDLRQQEVVAEKVKASQERNQNIQYALMALGIIVILSLYLLLSRSFITNTKMIEFFGVISLLIVFEFLNLLLHPLLEKITHHSPLLMLLALVSIAALLVPLHHKVEKWATQKLIQKNKKVRLAAARKTIRQLEKNES